MSYFERLRSAWGHQSTSRRPTETWPTGITNLGSALFSSSSPLTVRGALTYQQHIGQTLVTALFLRNRLTSCDTTGSFDWENAPPNNDLQALHINGDAQDKLREEIYDVFRKWIWVDFSRGPNLCMRVCEEAAMPPAEERLRPSFTNRYRPIESEGDGMRSYTATCMALLLSRRPLCLIDEPETCLHPPQAYRIGRFIGEHAGSAGNALPHLWRPTAATCARDSGFQN